VLLQNDKCRKQEVIFHFILPYSIMLNEYIVLSYFNVHDDVLSYGSENIFFFYQREN
jgi:hypothetical protein